jgi:hypothetical protein
MESASTAADDSREPTDADQTDDAPARGRRGRGAASAPNAIPEFHALRTPQYTYVEYMTGERELYDIAKDRDELNNLARKANATLVQGLSSRLKRLMACAAASCREAEAK